MEEFSGVNDSFPRFSSLQWTFQIFFPGNILLFICVLHIFKSRLDLDHLKKERRGGEQLVKEGQRKDKKEGKENVIERLKNIKRGRYIPCQSITEVCNLLEHRDEMRHPLRLCQIPISVWRYWS